MDKKEWKASMLLTLAAMIWGFAFVAQRVGSRYIGSFTLNGIRFSLGAFSLLPVMVIQKKKQDNGNKENVGKDRKSENQAVWKVGISAGFILFIAAGLQQLGLVETTAGKAAFITGFYIILVPVFGIYLKQKTRVNTWVAATLAIIGLYFISIEDNFIISRGDFLVFLCSFFFAAHILLISKYTRKMDTLKLSFVQYLTCSVLSSAVALFMEDIHLSNILKAAIPIIYGGVFSVGIAYTLQVIGQKHAKPSSAAIIMSLESVFALIGGIIILHESMNWKGYVGCFLMLVAVLLSQYRRRPVKEMVDTPGSLNQANSPVQ